MYLPFIKFFFGFLAFLIPVWLFYITIRKKLPNKWYVTALYWIVPLGFAVTFICIRYFTSIRILYGGIQWLTTWLVWFYVIWLMVFLIYAIFYWLDLLFNKIFNKNGFKLKYFVVIPLIIIFLIAYFQGTLNRKNIKIKYANIEVKNLPQGFNDTKIAVLGDTHFGSFRNSRQYFSNIAQLINEQNVDLVLFTGDLINAHSFEGRAYVRIFKTIKAKYGKYAVMGNHDFCDYYRWKDDLAKANQMDLVKQLYNAMGFEILDNKYVILEKDSLNRICLVGADKTSDLQSVIKNSPDSVLKILLYHNPKIWEKEVVGKETEVALTIAGHTHAWQCAFYISGKKISPASWLFPQWDGKYTEGGQTLYITRGVGYVGTPVKIGIKPEISILTLKSY